MPRLKMKQISAVALVHKNYQPVNPDAVIEVVKAEDGAAQDGFTARVRRSLLSIFKGATSDGAYGDGPYEGADYGDSEMALMSPQGDHSPMTGTHSHVFEGSTGPQAHSHDGDNNHSPATLATMDGETQPEGTTMDVMCKATDAFLAALDAVEKADVGAAVMAEARQHVPSMRAEAQQFLRLLRQTADGRQVDTPSGGVEDSDDGQDTMATSGDVTKAQDGGVEQTEAGKGAQDEMTPEDIKKAIEEGVSAVLPQLMETVKTEVAAQVAAAVTPAVQEATAPIAKAIEDAGLEAARRVPAMHPVTTRPGQRVQKDITGQDFGGALRTLLND